VVWFGIGVGPGILTAFLISFFPIMVNIATGLATLEPELEDVLRVLGAKRWDVLVKVGLPRSMPYFYGSLKVAITLAFVGTTVSEMTAANEGIGYLLISPAAMQMGLAFAGLVVVGAMAMAMYELFSSSKSAPPAGRTAARSSGVRLVQLPGNDVVVQPEHRALWAAWRSRNIRLPVASTTRVLSKSVMSALRSLCMAHDVVRGADGQVSLGRAVGHRPGGEVAVGLHHVAAVETARDRSAARLPGSRRRSATRGRLATGPRPRRRRFPSSAHSAARSAATRRQQRRRSSWCGSPGSCTPWP
jgi:hypothetical protein